MYEKYRDRQENVGKIRTCRKGMTIVGKCWKKLGKIMKSVGKGVKSDKQNMKIFKN